MNINKDGHIERVEKKGDPLVCAVENIVANHTAELDKVIYKIRELLKDDTDQLTDLEIDDIMLQLPILLYEITDDQEVVGIQSDLANQLYKEAYNEAYKIARGTIADKTSVAELNSLESKLDSFIYDRSYKIIKQKVDMAKETLNAVKKVQASRQQRYDFGKFSIKF